MAKQLMVGQVLRGFCAGYFGRDSYGDKRVEAVGIDWVVVRTKSGSPVFTSGLNLGEILTRASDDWPTEEELAADLR